MLKTIKSSECKQFEAIFIALKFQWRQYCHPYLILVTLTLQLKAMPTSFKTLVYLQQFHVKPGSFVGSALNSQLEGLGFESQLGPNFSIQGNPTKGANVK